MIFNHQNMAYFLSIKIIAMKKLFILSAFTAFGGVVFGQTLNTTNTKEKKQISTSVDTKTKPLSESKQNEGMNVSRDTKKSNPSTNQNKVQTTNLKKEDE